MLLRVREWLDRRRAWYHDDNQFSSRKRMDRAHAPIVDLAVSALGPAGGTVLDLGCGNGALLAKVCGRCPAAVPVGVERDPARAEHARRILRRFSGGVVTGDVFALPSALSERRYALVLLSISRLRDDPSAAPRLLDWVRARGERLLVFAYGPWIERAGSLAALAAPFGIETGPTPPSARAAVARRF
jgi:hypothetical protein